MPDKVLSVFEQHTEANRKGKIARPTEFGKLVTIQEAEHQIAGKGPLPMMAASAIDAS